MKTVKTQVRIPIAIHQWIVKTATANNRSMNGEIVQMLNEIIESQKEIPKHRNT